VVIQLILVKRTDPRYQDMRNRHYVLNKGTHGQQLHYLIFDDNRHVGIISGASPTYDVAPRDRFFNLPTDRKCKEAKRRKEAILNQIINNTVFRIEHTRKNLATQTLALWRRRIAADWEYLYQVPVLGFETFVVEEDHRKGTLYLADNWTCLGETKGSTKAHHKDAGGGGMDTSHTRRTVDKKLIFCIRRKGIKQIERYEASWRDKERARVLTARRKKLFKAQDSLMNSAADGT
jgi:hypothetical protein